MTCRSSKSAHSSARASRAPHTERHRCAVELQMPRLSRRVEPVVVPAVHVLHGGKNQLAGRQIVQRRKRDGDVVAADLFDVTVGVDAYAAPLAKYVMVI